MPVDETERPEFRGCVFCYSAECAYYGAKTAAGKLSGSHSDYCRLFPDSADPGVGAYR